MLEIAEDYLELVLLLQMGSVGVLPAGRTLEDSTEGRLGMQEDQTQGEHSNQCGKLCLRPGKLKKGAKGDSYLKNSIVASGTVKMVRYMLFQEISPSREDLARTK